MFRTASLPRRSSLPSSLVRRPGRAAALALALSTAAGAALAAPPVAALADAGASQPVAVVNLASAAPAAQPVAALPAAPTAAQALQLSQLERQMLDLVNADRAANGLAPVEYDPSLQQIARARAEAQKPLQYLNHFDPSGKLVFTSLFKEDGITFNLAGENLARLGGLDDTTGARAQDALMHSPTHRANILERSFNRLAIGATIDDHGKVILAQIYRAA